MRGASVNKKLVLLIALGVLVLLLAGGLLGLYIAGFRYMKVTYVSKASSEEQKISFLGFMDGAGSIKSGKLTYDGKNATVKKTSPGQFTITFENGDVYTGEMDGLQRHGQGVMAYVSGDRYEGSFAGDRFDGQGVFEYAGGDRYVGSFAAGKKSGEGHYTWVVDGVTYAEYTGSFKNDRREGKGVLKSADGAVYNGCFVNDLRQDGNAEALIPSETGGTDRYFGGYQNDVRSGFGYYYYAAGNVYAGYFENNKPEGEGVICYADGGGKKGTFSGGNLVQDTATDLTPEEVQEYLDKFSSNVNPLTGQPSVITG